MDQIKDRKTVLSEEAAQNSGERAAESNANPKITLEEAKNANQGHAPNGAGGSAVSSVENHIPSTSDPNATDIPSTDHPNDYQPKSSDNNLPKTAKP